MIILLVGDGQDTFVFLLSNDTSEDYDIISDFVSGEDILDLSAHNPGHLSDAQMFNSLYIIQEDGGTSIYIDTLNVIRLTGVDTISPSDFVFS